LETVIPYYVVMQQIARRSATSVRARGRPREFDMDAALDKAVRVFRERGYHATSIGNLTEAMEIATGSVYKAFRDKQDVFLAAFDRYTAARTEQVRRAATTAKCGRDKLRAVLRSYVESSQGVEGRRGCLVVSSAVELAAVDPVIAARVADSLKANEAFLAGLIRLGQSDGSIGSHIKSDHTARLMICLTQGMRVVGKTGRLRLEAAPLVDVAMKLLA
jgi:TetR/AcrR family transcriptional regulator, transcriptional repressor for nem operon